MTTTYSTLIADIQTYSDRDDLTTKAPDLLEEAEYRVAQDVFPYGVRKYVSATMTAGDRLITRPVRMLFAEDLRIIVSGSAVPLRKREYSYVRDFAPNNTIQAQPQVYAEMGPDYLIVAPTPNSGYSFELEYMERLAPLAPGNQTNFLTDAYPNLLRYAALFSAANFVKNREDIPRYEKLYQDEVARVKSLEALRMTRG